MPGHQHQPGQVRNSIDFQVRELAVQYHPGQCQRYQENSKGAREAVHHGGLRRVPELLIGRSAALRLEPAPIAGKEGAAGTSKNDFSAAPSH